MKDVVQTHRQRIFFAYVASLFVNDGQAVCIGILAETDDRLGIDHLLADAGQVVGRRFWWMGELSIRCVPDRLDITREDPPAMLTFGGGARYCLGVHLARVELTEALRIITQRMPNPRRNEPAQWKAMTGIIGPTSLPLQFDAGR